MIKLLASSSIVDNALTYALSHKLAPLTVAVLDARGCTIALKAEDGSSLLRPEIVSRVYRGPRQIAVNRKAIAFLDDKNCTTTRDSHNFA